jgi:transcriptional regulator with XRE-family HTH domain
VVDKRSLLESIAGRLRTIRGQWQLTLGEVEARSLRFAQEKGDQSYQVSASWLVRLEHDHQELTVNKLIALAHIYKIPAEQLLRSIYPESPQPIHRQLSSPNVTMLLSDGPLGPQAKYLIPDIAGSEPPDETALLSPQNGLLPAPL